MRVNDLVIRPLDRRYHPGTIKVHDFREQIGVLYPMEVDEKKREVTLIRTFVYVCESGAASLDPEHPGVDSHNAWEEMYAMIKDGACGFFHTHPPQHYNWSPQDIRAQNGIAKALGNKLLWHGVQAAASVDYESKFVCCWMNHGRVFRYAYPKIKDNLDHPLIRLPMPPSISWHNDAYTIYAPYAP